MDVPTHALDLDDVSLKMLLDKHLPLTVTMFDLSMEHAREMERYGFLGHFGNVGVRGYGKVPKAYFLTRKGYELLTREADIPAELFEPHKETHVAARWTPNASRCSRAPAAMRTEIANHSRQAMSKRRPGAIRSHRASSVR